MSQVSPLHYYAKSRIEVDWHCPRKRFYSYEYGDSGMAVDGTFIELAMGQTLHDGLAAIASGVDIDSIAIAAREQMLSDLGTGPDDSYAMEQSSLAEGILRGFHRYMWPRLTDRFPKIELVEQSLLYPHDETGKFNSEGPFKFFAKPDLLPEDKEGNLYYIEYKSTSSSKPEWVNSWQTAIQVHSCIRAVKATLGRDVTAVIIQGLYKGYYSYGKQNSPFCYAYYKQGNPPFTSSQHRYDYAPGFKKYPVWLMDGGVKAWVENMPEQLLSEQFPQTPPIFINDNLIDAFFRQRALRENEIRVAAQAMRNPDGLPDVKQMVLDMTFPQRFDKCEPSFGKPCEFKKVCHGPVGIDPFDYGYRPRSNRFLEEIEKLEKRP